MFYCTTPNRIDTDKRTPRYIIVQLLKTKDKKKLLSSREKKDNASFKEANKLTDDATKETMKSKQVGVTFSLCGNNPTTYLVPLCLIHT